MNWRDKKVLITGAAGFLGSHLAEALAPLVGELTCLVKYNARSSIGNLEYVPRAILDRFRIIYGNIEDSEFLRQNFHGIDVVFHLAALIGIPYSYVANQSYISTNVAGTLNVLQACRANSVGRMIHVSTSEVFGSGQYFPMDEKHPLVAQSPYAASKIAADKLVESFHRSYGLPTVITRPFNCYGPRQSARAVIPSIIIQMLSSDAIRLGSTTTVRDFTFVSDMVTGLIAAAGSEAAVGEEINLGSGSACSIGEIAQQCMQITGISKPILRSEERLRPGDSEVHKLICDSSKASSLLQWKASSSLRDGLTETIEFLKDHLPVYHPDRFAI